MPLKIAAHPARAQLRRRLLAWYDAHARDLPWRIGPARRREGARPDPYRVWLSEIMLQQTTVTAVIPYYERFLDRFPDVGALAAASLAEVLKLWAGLGYYARARNLHACAKAVAAAGGAFPDTEAGLLKLPGIGPYTAAAIAAIVFDEPANVVDGNVERVMARLFAEDAPLPAVKPKLKAHAASLAGDERSGDYAQALMDLGATVCTPRGPDCAACPWRPACRAYATGTPEAWPKRAAKAAKPQRHGAAFVLCRDGLVLLRRRPARGLLGGMPETPTTVWRDGMWTDEEALGSAPADAKWRKLDEPVSHVFTHFALILDVWRADAPARFKPGPEEWWGAAGDLDELGLPSVMRKVVARALSPERRARRKV